MNTLSLVSASTALLFLANPLAGQESTTRGFHLGFHLQAASLTIENGDAAGGGGAGFRIGYGINRLVTLYFEGDGIAADAGDPDVLSGTWALGHGEVGARFHFANSLRSWVPFLDVAIGGRAATITDVVTGNQDLEDVEVSGGAFSFGGGIYAYFTETLALEVGAKFSTGTFSEVDLGVITLSELDIDAQSARFKVGLVWWP
jgi:hypothetical protein